MQPRIHFLETVDEAAISLIDGERFTVTMPQDEVDCTRVRALIVRGKEAVDKALLDRCPELRVIARCGVGVNNVDVAEATSRGIQVLNAPGVNAATVAEHTIGLLLLLVRGMYRLVREVKNDNWDYRNTYGGHELRNLTLGIVGAGDIGKKVGGIAGAMGMRILEAGRSAPDRAHLLRNSDVVTLHVPLTDATRNLIDAEALALVKPGAFLVNTARGEVVDARALLTALEDGRLAGYASDLLPVGDAGTVAALRDRDDVLITPHAASLTALTFREMSELTVTNTLAYLTGGPVDPRYRVNTV